MSRALTRDSKGRFKRRKHSGRHRRRYRCPKGSRRARSRCRRKR